jgi:transposase
MALPSSKFRSHTHNGIPPATDFRKETGMAHFDLTDFEWSVIQPLLPTKVRGAPRVDDRRVLNGIFWRLRTGAPWADIPLRYGPPTTCVDRFNRWRKAGVWARILEAVSLAYDGDIHMIDSSSIRVHQRAANAKKRWTRLHGSLARRPDDQDPCGRRCGRHADRAQADGRSGP